MPEPPQPTSVADLVAAAAGRFGRRPALLEDRDGGRRLTWADLEAAVARAAGVLRARGVRPGDAVLVALPNSAAYAIAAWGVLRAGGVVVPANPAYTVRELTHLLADASVRAAVADPLLAGRVRKASLQAAAGGAAATVLEPADLAAAEAVAVAAGDATAPDDAAVICYTSGTTGRPKGAVLTHGNLLANLAAFGDLERLTLTSEDVVLGVLPFFHVFGLNVVLNAAARAGAAVVAIDRFSPSGSLETMRRHGVTVAYGAPPVFAAWAAAADAPVPSLRAAVSGADSLPVRTFAAFGDRYGLEIYEGYGLTETAPVLTSTAVSPRVRAGTVGHPVPSVEVRVIGPEGTPAPTGEVGEIAARGPNVFAGYHGQPEATAEVVDADGWFRTGDLGCLDADGYLTISGRLKDLVIVSGFNVYPREVEEVLLGHPDVAEAAVVGLPDARTGERVRALVVPTPGATAGPEDLLAHCRAELARYKVPREIELVEALPRTALGKLSRARLRGS
jgi:long-chain acyl-CoA synthetase